MALAHEDLKYIQRLKEVQIFQNVNAHLIDQKHGVILVTCSDGNQMYDMFQYQVRTQNRQIDDPRIHLQAMHAGPARLSKKSRINKPDLNSDLTYMEGIAEAVRWTSIQTIILQIHTPCRKVKEAGLTFQESLELLIEAKLRIKKEIPETNIFCFCHIDYGDRKRTKFVNRQNFEKWHQLILDS